MGVPSSESSGQPASSGWRIALFLFIVSGALWFGGSHIRTVIGGELLKFGTLKFDDYLPPDAEREIFRLLSLTSLFTITCYLVMLASSIVFLATSPYRLKEHGWLMMSAILFYLFVPVELYISYLDGRIAYADFFTTVDMWTFREQFVARVGALAGAPLIATLCYYTIIGLFVFRPLKRKEQTGQ